MFLEVYLEYITLIYLLANFVVWVTYIYYNVIIQYLQRKIINVKNENLWLKKILNNSSTH